jgi:hypothetical protein
MKISVNQDDSFQLEQVYLPITLVTDAQEEMSIVMRDSGFEFKYQGEWYEAKEGKVELLKKTVSFSDEVLSDKQPDPNVIKWVETRTF